MSRRDDRTLLADMLHHARQAVDAVADRQRPELDSDLILRAALERFMEIIGEAASRVTPQRRDQLSEFPWADIIGMRNRLVHGYAEVNHDILWKVVRDDLPRLVESLRRHLAE